MLYPTHPYNAVVLADEHDIAAMKLSAIAGRGAKKDFIDLHVLLKQYSLEELLECAGRKFARRNYNRLHLIKSLTYFDDAEEEPMPVMLQSITWDAVKDTMKKHASRLVG